MPKVSESSRIGVDQVGAMNANLPPQQAIEMAILVLSIIPILLVYPFVQKYFTKGVLTSAVEG